MENGNLISKIKHGKLRHLSAKIKNYEREILPSEKLY